MAIVFELSAHFGPDELAARQFAEHIRPRYHSLQVGSHHIDLHDPLVSQIRDAQAITRYEVSIIPVAVGAGVALDKDRPRLRLTTEELSRLGQQLYDLLRGLDGYQVASVGWDVDRFDLSELRSDYCEELLEGSLHGLVIARELRHQLPASPHFVPFDELHDWIPYRGTPALT